jgi:hypothetical protein
MLEYKLIPYGEVNKVRAGFSKVDYSPRDDSRVVMEVSGGVAKLEWINSRYGRGLGTVFLHAVTSWAIMNGLSELGGGFSPLFGNVEDVEDWYLDKGIRVGPYLNLIGNTHEVNSRCSALLSLWDIHYSIENSG